MLQLRFIRGLRQGVSSLSRRGKAKDSKQFATILEIWAIPHRSARKAKEERATGNGEYEGKGAGAWDKGAIRQVDADDVQGYWQWEQPADDKLAKCDEVNIIDQDG